MTLGEIKLLEKGQKITLNYKFNDPNYSSYISRIVNIGIMSPAVAPEEYTQSAMVIFNNEDIIKLRLDSNRIKTIEYLDIADDGTIRVDSIYHIQFT